MIYKKASNYLNNFFQGVAHRGFNYQLRAAIATEINKRRFKSLNTGLKGNQIALTPEIILNIRTEDYFGFRYFTDIDPEMVEEMQAFIRLSASKKCLLDIGAYYGIFSLVFASKPDAISVAIEPSPQAYRVLNHYLQINPQCNINSFPLAMGKSQGSLQMYYDEQNHLVSQKEKSLKLENEVEVKVDTIDNLISQQQLIPDVIKIDTEGFELNVLQGARETLQKYSPLIFLEVHPQLLQELGQSVKDIVKYLSEIQYKICDFDLNLIKDPASSLEARICRVVCCKEAD